MITKPTTYTPEYVLAELTEMLDTLHNDTDIVYLGELLEFKPYSKQRVSEWKDMSAEITESMAKIKDILETRAIVGGLKNKLSSPITKFHLINNYGWRDKTEIDATSNGETIGGFNFVHANPDNQTRT